MSQFDFLGQLELSLSPLLEFWQLAEHDTPNSPGVYLLVAKEDFMYPKGKSRVFYIGQSTSLKNRLSEHLKRTQEVREDKRDLANPIYWPRYEYGNVFGKYYCYVKAPGKQSPKDLEDIVLARFALTYFSFPVANGAGAWNRIKAEFAQNER
jgi:hypothetical protein